MCDSGESASFTIPLAPLSFLPSFLVQTYIGNAGIVLCNLVRAISFPFRAWAHKTDSLRLEIFPNLTVHCITLAFFFVFNVALWVITSHSPPLFQICGNQARTKQRILRRELLVAFPETLNLFHNLLYCTIKSWATLSNSGVAWCLRSLLFLVVKKILKTVKCRLQKGRRLLFAMCGRLTLIIYSWWFTTFCVTLHFFQISVLEVENAKLTKSHNMRVYLDTQCWNEPESSFENFDLTAKKTNQKNTEKKRLDNHAF